MKSASPINNTYQFGLVESIHIGKDGKIRKAEIRYRNHNESIDRITFRAVRQLVIIHHVDELDVSEQLSLAAN